MKGIAAFLCIACSIGLAQQTPVFKDETRVVLIDAVVTGKKGEYVRDLTAKDFRVWEDGKQQAVKSFALESGPAVTEPRRLVLFFDDAGMSAAEQAATRQAAARFIDANAGPGRLMAVVTFGGGFRVAQNFTDDAGKLKEALRGARLETADSSTPDPPIRRGPSGRSRPAGAETGRVTAPGLMQAAGNLGANLNAAPGRKIIVLFTGENSFSSLQPDSAARLAQVCNRSNVALYPVFNRTVEDISVRDISGNPTGPVGLVRPGINTPANATPAIRPGANLPDPNLLSTIAKETGGFVVPSFNDLAGELQKIGAEQDQYYVLGYTPPDSKEGACHKLRVAVDRSHVAVRARSSYCTAKPRDLLAESKVERDLEKRAAVPAAGGATAAIEAPFFYAAPGIARVHVAMEIPTEALKFRNEKGRMHAEMNVLGIATAQDGGVAARFSDVVRQDLDKERDVAGFKEKPLHYEKEFRIVPGKYKLTVVFGSGGENFGTAETALIVDAYKDGELTLSGIALGKQVRPAAEVGLEASLAGDVAPLIASGMQIIPSGTNVFTRGEQAFCYFEIYAAGPVDAAATMDLRIVDAATGARKWESGPRKLDGPVQGKSSVPIGLKMPIEELPPGSYRLEVTASDGQGETAGRAVGFDVR